MHPIRIDEQLLLVPLRRESAEEIFNAIDQHRDLLRSWLPFVDPTTKKEFTEQFIDYTLNHPGPKKDILFELRADGEYIGMVGLKEVDQVNLKTELGYWIIPEYEGQGRMTAAVKAVCKHAFDDLNLHRVQIKVAVGNARSSRIPEKLGFNFEGIETDGEWLNGRYVDLEVYSMLEDDCSF